MFETIDQIKEYVGGAANVSIQLESLTPAIHAASMPVKYWLSPNVYAALDAAVVAGNLTAAQTALLPYVRRPLALLTMHEHVKTGNIQITESGVQRHESENYKTAYKYQENQYKEQMRRLGYEAIEEMINFLHDNLVDYSDYASSSAYTRSTSYLINSAAAWRDSYNFEANRYTFELLLPVIDDVENIGIADCISADELSTLRTAYHADTASAKQKTVIKLLQRAIAQFTFALAVKRNLVQLQGRNVVQRETPDSAGYEKTSVPMNSQLDFPLKESAMAANQFLAKALDYMRANLDDFPEYKTKYEAELAAQEELDQNDPNYLVKQIDSTYDDTDDAPGLIGI